MAKIRDQPEYKLKIGKNYLLIDDKKFQLLDKIDICGSISKASQKAKMPYRTALKYIELMEKILDSPVVISERGGKGGGGSSRLTETGKLIVKEYLKFNKILQKHDPINEIEGRIKTVDSKNQLMSILVNDHEIIIPFSEDFKRGDTVLILLSPEEIFIMEKKQKSSVRNVIKGKILGMELKDNMVRLKIDLGENIPISVDITHYSWHELNLDLEKEVFVGFKATSLRVIKI